MNKTYLKRGIALILSIAMMFTLVIPVSAVENTAEPTGRRSLSFVETEVPEGAVPEGRIPAEKDETAAVAEYADDEMVRVSIVLDQPSTIDRGYSTVSIANNASAMAYRDSLKVAQVNTEAAIETQALNGADLDVVWNLTLAANIISANVRYGDIEAIKAVSGVKDVIIETRYAPAVVDDNLPVDPNMATSSSQIGSNVAWSAGYYGAGSKVAIIDTGIDLDHELFNDKAFDYAISQSHAESELMTEADVAANLSKLNIAKNAGVTADKLYLSTKVPFAYNYIDKDFEVTHDTDTEGEHGSHVTGIAAANRYVQKEDGSFVPSLDEVKTMGVAPDAQVLTMKVFGKGGGAYDSDYMAAIEDAVILGADSVNLSLGSSNPGPAADFEYADILESLTEHGTVVTISAGNAGKWSDEAYLGALYADDVSFDTVGSPGSYTNALTVASVDNNGQTGAYFMMGDDIIFYTETSGAGNEPFTTIAGDYDFVYVDSMGSPEEFAAVDVEGKIALCNRGTTSFFEKANAAAAAGAAGVIVVNNQAGTISMALDGYLYTAPVVSITMADGDFFRTNPSTVTIVDPETEEETTIDVYTGKVTVGSGVASSDPYISVDDKYTMSDFSSWGVPGSLELKPEITAPGGNIYSVNGLIEGGQGYENMSGTSMAAPQVAGMAAVLAEYIRENGLEAKTGLTQRQLINSLLMSTARPVYESDGSYYSVLNQGAGLADVGSAVYAGAVITMADGANKGANDGKVKVELGDDPDKKGEYSFTFKLTNISDHKNLYTFDTNLFTQDIDSGLYLSPSTIALNADVDYTIDGAEFIPFDCDVDKDGDTDGADVKAILEVVTGEAETNNEDYDLTVGDLDKDGKYSSYDAYLLLRELYKFGVNPGQTITVKVDMTLDDAKLANYENGAYVEGYTYVIPVADTEGLEDTMYSIPILGFYGNWSDPSMFERITYKDYYLKDYDYPPYTGTVSNDIITYVSSVDGEEYELTGNPLEPYEGYDDKLSLNANDDLSAFTYSLIRNGYTALVITDEDGNYLAKDPVYEDGAFYYTSGAAWMYTSSDLIMGISPADIGCEDGDKITLSLYAAPEYNVLPYVDDEGYISGDDFMEYVAPKLGKGAVMEHTITIDSEKPVLESAELDEDGNLVLTVSDNFHVAGVGIMVNTGAPVDASSLGLGTFKWWSSYLPDSVEATEDGGELATITIPAEDIEDFGLANMLFGNGEMTNDCYIVPADYADNEVAYYFDGISDVGDVDVQDIELPVNYEMLVGTSQLIPMEITPALITPDVFTWESSDEDVATVKDGVVTALKEGETVITVTYEEDPAITSSCLLTVSRLDVTATGVLADAAGQPRFFTYDFGGAGLVMGSEVAQYPIQVADFGSTFALMNTDYTMYLMDKATGQVDPSQAPVAWDTESPTPWGMTATPNNTIAWTYGYYLMVEDNPFAPSYMAFNFQSRLGGAYLRGVACDFTPWEYNLDGTAYQGEYTLYAVDTLGRVWQVMVYHNGGNISALIGGYPSDFDASILKGYNGDTYSNLVYGKDGALYYSVMTGDTNEIYRLTYVGDEEDGEYVAMRIGDVGYDVWPALLFDVTSNAPAAKNAQPKNVEFAAATEIAQRITPAAVPYPAPKAFVAPVEQVVDPAPIEPVPSEPTPVEPAPVEPTPDEPVTEPVTEPAPEEPAPAEPAPEEPAPEEGVERIHGSLNSIVPGDSYSGDPERYVVIDRENNLVEVTISADDTTNGAFEVLNANPEIFTYETYIPLLPYVSADYDTAANTTNVAFAAILEKPTPVVTLVYSYKDEEEETLTNLNDPENPPFTVTGIEDGEEIDMVPVEYPLLVANPTHTHRFAPVSDMYNHGMRCIECGQIIAFGPHTFVNGMCTFCGYIQPNAGLPVQPALPATTPEPTDPDEVVVVDQATEGGEGEGDNVDVSDTDTDDVNVGDTEAAEANPKTGVAFSALALAMSAVACAISKRR